MKSIPSEYVDSKSETEKFYLPAMAAPETRSRVEAVVTDLFDLHGRVLVPRTPKR